MKTLIRLELLRVARDRGYWFWALIGVPVLAPALLALLGFAMLSAGTVEPQNMRPEIATTVVDNEILSELELLGLPADTFEGSEGVSQAITQGQYSVGLVDVVTEPGQPLRATILTRTDGRRLPIYTRLEEGLDTLARNRRNDLIDELSFDGPSFDLLLEPIVVQQARVPDRLPSGLVQVVTLTWFTMLVFPCVLLVWNGGSRAVTDRMSGYLAVLNAGAMSTWKWLTVRWLTLSTVAACLVLFCALLAGLYMRAFGTIADLLVAEGILEGLSDSVSIKVQAYLVDMVRIWRETSFVSLSLWVLVAIVQLSAVCALVLFGSVLTSSLGQYRFVELVPFIVLFLLPMIGLGALGTGINSSAWVPGLNTVLASQHVVTGQLPGVEFFSSAGIVLLVSTLMIGVCLVGANFSMRRERLWAG